MTITLVSLTDTFLYWLLRTNDAISAINGLSNGSTAVANTTITGNITNIVSNNQGILVTGSPTGVSGTIYLNTGTLDVDPNDTSTSNIASANVVNSIHIVAWSAFNKANNAVLDAQGAYGQANIATLTAQGAYGQANNAVLDAQGAYGQANIATLTAQGAYGQANIAVPTSQSAFNQANNAVLDAQGAFNQANTAYNNMSSYANITDANNAVIGQISSYNNANNQVAVAANFPDLGGTGPVWWNLFAYGGPTRITQLATQAFNVSNYQSKSFVRSLHDTTWSACKEIDSDVAVSAFAKANNSLQYNVELQGPATGGVNITSKDLGNLSGQTITPNPGSRGIQKITNNGAGTIAPGTNYGAYILEIINTTGAGAITLSGWTKVSGSIDTTTTSKFECHCVVTADFSAMIILKVV